MTEQIILNEKIVGTIDKNIFHKFCLPKHFMFKYQGFGISKNILNYLKSKEVDTIIIEYKGKTRTALFKTSLEAFLKSEKKHKFNDNDEQNFLSIKEMECIK